MNPGRFRAAAFSFVCGPPEGVGLSTTLRIFLSVSFAC